MSVRFAVGLLLLSSISAPVLAQSASANRSPALLIHGNYCGPGNNAPLPPIDALDAACARHDTCTPTGRLPSNACNLRLQREAEGVSRDPRQPHALRDMAGLVAAAASLMPADQEIQPVAVAVRTRDRRGVINVGIPY